VVVVAVVVNVNVVVVVVVVVVGDVEYRRKVSRKRVTDM
jgi:hypothetical protein